MFMCKFVKDARLAKPLVLKEWQRVKTQHGPSALRNFMSKWHSAVEKLVQNGDRGELDQDLVYITFSDSFMSIHELKEY